MTHEGPHADSYARPSAWTALEDSDQTTVRYSVCISLQSCVADLVELHSQSRQARWNVVGEHFRSLRLELDDIITVAVNASEQVAERIRALGGVPEGRSERIAVTNSLPGLPGGLLRTPVAFELLIDRLGAAIETLRDVQSISDKHDPPSSGLLNGIVVSLENQRWKLKAMHSNSR